MLRLLFSFVLLSVIGLSGCGAPERDVSDLAPPMTNVEPAGGIYAQLPATIQLTSEDGATIHYRWNQAPKNEKDGKRYTEPIAFPATNSAAPSIWTSIKPATWEVLAENIMS